MPGEYAVDGLEPGAVVFPASVEEVSRVLAYAADEGKAVSPWGGGTKQTLGNVPSRVDLVLGTQRLSRLLFHEPQELVASAEAGMTLAAFQEELARAGQYVPLESPAPERATLGGILACNAAGPSRLAHGTPRDWLIGIRVAHPGGTVTKAGARVVKNVTGYDMNKLYTGSLGTLGLIGAAIFKVTPLPAEEVTILASYDSASQALESAAEVLRARFMPNALHVVTAPALARLPTPGGGWRGEAAVACRMAGRKAAVQRKLDDAAAALGDGSPVRLETLSREKGAPLWQGIIDLGWVGPDTPELAARINALPSRVGDLVTHLLDIGSGGSIGVLADPGYGQVRICWWPGEETAGEASPLEALGQAARSAGGHMVVERCPLEIKAGLDVWGEDPGGLDIMRRVKAELDPLGIMNPGRFIGRL